MYGTEAKAEPFGPGSANDINVKVAETVIAISLVLQNAQTSSTGRFERLVWGACFLEKQLAIGSWQLVLEAIS